MYKICYGGGGFAEDKGTVEDLYEKNLLYWVILKFCDSRVDLHPDKVSNHEMGTIFEEFIRKFNEATNENPGEHFTSREVIQLMVKLLVAKDGEYLSRPKNVTMVYESIC